jgi:hypothetical protein
VPDFTEMSKKRPKNGPEPLRRTAARKIEKSPKQRLATAVASRDYICFDETSNQVNLKTGDHKQRCKAALCSIARLGPAVSRHAI